MKIIHIPYCFHPDAVGGTEVYVEALAREQSRQGIRPLIAAPAPQESACDWQGLAVRRFFEGTVRSTAELYGEGNAEAAQSFSRILDAESPDIVHLHAFSRAVSLRLVRECRRRGIPVVFSYHTPSVTCLRGTLMLWGREVCDGHLDARRCSQCKLHALGLNRLIGAGVTGLPLRIRRPIAGLFGSGGLSTALLLPEFVSRHHDVLRALLQEVDHIVAFRQWAKEVLLRAGVPASKVTVSPQGLLSEPHSRSLPQREPRIAGSPLRLAFFGRFDPVKGVDLLIQAVRRIAGPDLHLDLFGTQPDGRYVRRLRKLVHGDRRIRFQDPVAPADVIPLLATYDALVVPSQCLETGPLVVLEALAAGIPVIGSRRGGIAELVEHGVNGLLIEPADVSAWAQAITRAIDEPALLNGLRAGIRAPRDIRACVSDMQPIYSALLQEVH